MIANLPGSGIVEKMCDVIQLPSVVKFAGEVPSENRAEVVSNVAVSGRRVGGASMCNMSTQTDSVDDELSWLWPGCDQDCRDTEHDDELSELDFVPYEEPTRRRPLDELNEK